MKRRRRAKTEDRPRVAVGYIRCSTVGQAVEGVTLEAQQTRIEKWCMGNDYELVSLQIDRGLSGKRADNRPGLQAALTEACERGAVLVVYSLSRLCRSTQDALAISERLADAGADLCSLTEAIDTTNPAGELFYTIVAAFGQFERRIIGERTAMGMQQKKAKGQFCGGSPPYGWRVGPDGVQLEPVPEEQATAARAAALRLEGRSLRAIGRILEAEGRPARGGRSWSAKVLSDILAGAPRAAAAA